MAEPKIPHNLTFEVALEELEQITHTLEEGKESLESSMKMYERGVALRELCRKKLSEAEGKWLLLKKGKNDKVTVEKIPSDKIPDPNELQGGNF